MKAIRIKQFGGPQVMQLTEVDVPEPKPTASTDSPRRVPGRYWGRVAGLCLP